MLNVLICGICGEMGAKVYESAKKLGLNVVCGVDKSVDGDFNCPIYRSFDEVREAVDVVIDFSVPELLNGLLDFAITNGCAIVEATTGYSDKQKEKLHLASKKIPIFMSVNMSLGVNLLLKLCILTAKTLNGYDIEIIDIRQAQKVNAPSNTAYMLAEELNEILGGNKRIISGRSSSNSPRHQDEICIHSIRGGSLVGENTIMFIGEGETITIKHEAHDKHLFADGACKVAEYMQGKKAGLYSMKDYFND